MLKELVEKNGPQSYADSPVEIPRLTLTLRLPKPRNQPQLQHAELYVTPKNKWTEDEDTILLKSHEEYGNRWTAISKLFTGRSCKQIKNRYYELQDFKDSDDSTSSGSSSPDSMDENPCKSNRSDKRSTPHSLQFISFQMESEILDPIEQEMLDYIASDMDHMRFQD